MTILAVNQIKQNNKPNITFEAKEKNNNNNSNKTAKIAKITPKMTFGSIDK